MKRLIAITALCALLLTPVITCADDFCLDFWQLVEETVVFVGGGCIAYDRVYHCTATASEIQCREVVCFGDPNPVTRTCQ